MNEYYQRVRFFYDSKPKSVRYGGIGFAFMVLTVILANISQTAIVMIFAGTIGLCGLVLFFMGAIYGVIDLCNMFRRKDKLSDNKV